MAGKFEVYKDKAGEFRFRLKAGNGQTILVGEGYKERGGVMNGVESVKKNAGSAERFERKTSTSEKPYFVLRAANHQVIGQSEMYESEDARDNGIRSVMANAPAAEVDDQTT